jgi:tetratricopeptide (TPR) repeat protein
MEKKPMLLLRRIGLMLTVIFMFSGASHALGQSCDTVSLQTVDALLAQSENQQAWDVLQKLQGEDLPPEQILWRKARTQYEMGRLVKSDQDALKLFIEAEKYAREAVKASPDKSDGYKWLAISLGAQSKFVDTKTQVQQSREIKENIDRAIALAPDDDIAYLVLSRWHYKISGLSFFAKAFAKIIYGGLPDASLDEAEKLLQQAIGLHDRIAHRYNLGKVYDRMDRQKDANEQYQKALTLPVTFPEEAEELGKARNKLQHR